MAGRRPRSERDARRRAHSQNFIRSQALAAELVADADITASDVVLDIGAGSGVLTAALIERARRVLAIEVDPAWARRLRERFADATAVTVVEGDVLDAVLPDESFRVFASIPFGRTTAILRHLMHDPRTPLTRADVIVQWEAACKRIALPPRNALTVEWSPWWRFRIDRRIAADCFRPVPAVDAALLVIERRNSPLLDASDRERFSAMVRQGFARAQVPLVHALHRSWSRTSLRRTLEAIGAQSLAKAGDLTLQQWIALFRSGG